MGKKQNLDSHSFSMVTTANRCLRLYKLNFIDKLRTFPPNSSALEFGTAMHAALQAELEGGDSDEVFRILWDLAKPKPLVYYGLSWEFLNDTGEVFLARFRRLHKKNFEIGTPMEQRIFGTLGPHKVEGTPDFVGLYKGVPSMIDFKTASKQYHKDRITVSDQLHLYRHLVKQQLGYDAKQLVYFVMIKKQQRIQVITQMIDEEEHQEILSNIENQIKELETRTVFHQNKDACLMAGSYPCDFWEKCHGKKGKK